MNFHQLSTFCAVLSEGSMTAAARKLFLTQPAISQQIRALEEQLEVRLLVRGVRQIKPTTQGQLLFDYAKRILHLSQQAEVAMKTWSTEISGRLRLGTINSLGMYLVSPIVGLFLKHNSKLSINLTYGSYAKVLEAMKKDEIDIAILPKIEKEFQQSMDGFHEKFLMKDEMWLINSGQDTSTKNSIQIKNFTQKPIVVFSESYPSFKKLFEQKMRQHKQTFFPVFETDNVGTLKRVVESGLGWGFLPSHCIKKQVQMRRLNHILIEDMTYSADICIYTRKDPSLKKMANVFYLAMQRQSHS